MRSHDEELICLGQIVAAYGIKGLCKVKTFTEIPQSLTSYGPLYTKDQNLIQINLVKVLTSQVVLITMNGCTNRNDAEKMVGLELFVPESSLPKLDHGEYYHRDLIGLHVIDEHKEVIGKVTSVQNYGGGDFIDIQDINTSKISTLIFNKEAVTSVDLQAKQIHIINSFLLR